MKKVDPQRHAERMAHKQKIMQERIARADKEHLAFGHGDHFCLGHALARMEGQVVLARLLDRLPSTRLAVEPAALAWGDSLVFHGLRALPLTFAPAAVVSGSTATATGTTTSHGSVSARETSEPTPRRRITEAAAPATPRTKNLSVLSASTRVIASFRVAPARWSDQYSTAGPPAEETANAPRLVATTRVAAG